MFEERTIACNALTAYGVGAFAGNKIRQDLVLPTVTTQGEKRHETCNGRGVVETKMRSASGRYLDDSARNFDRRFDRRDDRTRYHGGRGGRGGRSRSRCSTSNEWGRSGGGRGSGHYDGRDGGNHFVGSSEYIRYAGWVDPLKQPPTRASQQHWHRRDKHKHCGGHLANKCGRSDRGVLPRSRWTALLCSSRMPSTTRGPRRRHRRRTGLLSRSA